MLNGNVNMLVKSSVSITPENSLFTKSFLLLVWWAESANIICGEILYAELAYRRKFYRVSIEKMGIVRETSPNLIDLFERTGSKSLVVLVQYFMLRGVQNQLAT